MATGKSTSNPDPSVDLGSAEEAVKRIRDLNERLIESSKSAGLVALEAYEKSLQSMAEFEEKIATSSQLDWVSTIASTQAKFVQDVSSAYTSAARDLLK